MDLQKAGALIRKLRLEKQMTQRQLAEKMGVAPKTISNGNARRAFRMCRFCPIYPTRSARI